MKDTKDKDVLPKRKRTRLRNYDYSSPGAYFVTMCVKDRKELLSKIITGTHYSHHTMQDEMSVKVGTGVFDGPQSELTNYGKIANKHLMNMSNFYDNIKIDKYVIMPNHIHLLVRITEKDNRSGPSGTPVPTNSLIAQFVSTFKRFCNREYGENIWQSCSHDHIIRDKSDYEKIWKYIDTNVLRWELDCFYVE